MKHIHHGDSRKPESQSRDKENDSCRKSTHNPDSSVTTPIEGNVWELHSVETRYENESSYENKRRGQCGLDLVLIGSP